MGAWELPNALGYTLRGMISVIDALNMDCILAHASNTNTSWVPPRRLHTDLHHILQAYTLIINKVRYVGSGYVSISK